MINLATDTKITWCPGCPNSQILVSFRQAVTEFVEGGEMELHNIVAGAGVGCHGKISDYLEVNTFNSLHGRIVPSLTGIKLANPALNVVGFTGDGDSFSEGFSHITHAARRNSDISIFLHNNQVFALTTGQATTTSPKGFKGGTTPYGSPDEPINPALIMLAMGATFVARTYAGDIAKTKEIMKAAMLHKGFAFVDIIQPCITFFDTKEYYQSRVKWLTATHKKNNLDAAFKVARSVPEEKVPLGIFYQVDQPTFEEQVRTK
jgi:2-oxoglutarate/2-oxoacid ferredoxin oxidoreductase subunit beta